jgi:hypothetical protein
MSSYAMPPPLQYKNIITGILVFAKSLTLLREVNFFLVVTITPLLGSTSGSWIFAAASSFLTEALGSGI